MEIIHFDEINSTQKHAIEMVLQDKIYQNTAIITNIQTSGIGRRGTQWLDGKDNLMMSIILPSQTNKLQTKINSVEVGKLLFNIIKSHSTGQNIQIKEPNDLLIDGKKFCGTIINHENINNIYYVIIGIGINVKSSPQVLQYPITNLEAENIKVSKKNLANEIIIAINYLTDYTE